MESTFTLMVTVLAAVTAVPATKLPETFIPVQSPVPPSKEYLAVPPVVIRSSMLTSFWHETKKRTSTTAKDTKNKTVFFTIKILRLISLVRG